MYDVLIVGKGPAGISAALYATRANLKTLVIGRDLGALEKAHKIENYFGFAEPVDARQLLEDSIANALRLGAEVSDDEVLDLEVGDGFSVTAIKKSYAAKSVILATGRQRKRVNIKGLEGLEGRGVSYCAVCDGFFYRGKAIGVIGNSDYALHEVEELMNFTDNITLFTNGEKLQTRREPPCKVESGRIARIIGEKKVEGIELENETVVMVDGIFVAVGVAGSADFARKLGVEVRNGAVVTDGEGRTAVEGLFAAGDCVGDFLQVSTAVGQGALAARSAIEYLKGKKD